MFHFSGSRYLFSSPGIYVFAILKDHNEISAESLAEDLKALVKKKIAAFAIPNQFLVSSKGRVKIEKYFPVNSNV